MREFTSAEAELRYRQRSLTPLNLFVALISAIAALSILFLPLLRIDVDSLSVLLTGQASEEDTTTEVSVADFLSGTGLTVSMDGMDFVTLAMSDEPVDVLVRKVGTSFSEQSSTIAAKAVVVAAAESADLDVSDEAVEKVDGALRGLETAEDDTEIDAAITDILGVIKEDFLTEEQLSGWDEENARGVIREMYEKTVEQTEGAFSAEAFICVNASEALNESGSGTGEVYTNFSDMMSGMSASLSTEDVTAQIPPYLFVAAAGVILFFAFVWAVLFLFAFFHMFARNKRFMMWYVKLFGFFPCLIFGIAPIVAEFLIPDATIAAALGAISTLAWVSGVCYLLLWFVSIFWAFPIKHRIRQLNRQVRA